MGWGFPTNIWTHVLTDVSGPNGGNGRKFEMWSFPGKLQTHGQPKYPSVISNGPRFEVDTGGSKEHEPGGPHSYGGLYVAFIPVQPGGWAWGWGPALIAAAHF